MRSISIHAQVTPSGELKIDLPPEMVGLKVVITIQAPRSTKTWPAEFFEKFSGCMPDFPDVDRDELERHD